ncbi:hypothetical protein D3C71_938190 [compost metagenome]
MTSKLNTANLGFKSDCSSVLAGSIRLNIPADISSHSFTVEPLILTAFSVLSYRYKSLALLIAIGPLAISVYSAGPFLPALKGAPTDKIGRSLYCGAFLAI